jgi:phospholipid/cholesterol/gamma-HCH transport system permease protein
MTASGKTTPQAACEAVKSGNEMRLALSGDLNAHSLAAVWKQSVHAIHSARSASIVIDASQVRSCDGAGVGLLSYLLHLAKEKHIPVEIVHLKDKFRQMLERFAEPAAAEVQPREMPLTAVQSAGKMAMDLLGDIYEQIAFFGSVLMTGLRLSVMWWRFRWNDFFLTAENAGLRAVGIISLLGFLFGLIMAFSSAMPLRQFGVEVYVADLVAYAMVRVLGPILTAIIVAGRTGSAFAAELGTMKINHEIDALEVMNLDPVAFLVLPRVLATTLMTPLLTIAASLWGMVGSAVVILSLGYPLVTYTTHIQAILTVPDMMVGLVKAVVYGMMIGMVGCLRGLQTKIGAGAVGVSTTRAVVTSIILLVILEGIFSVLLYFLEI